MKKKLLCIVLVLCFPFSAGCSGRAKVPRTDVLVIEHDVKFGGAYLHISIEDFNALGFVCGDSVDVRFSNGVELHDIPYYNGYYTLTGFPLVCAYPGDDYVEVTVNNGDLFQREGLTEDCTATVTLNKSGKYRSVQDAMSLVYSVERGDYPSDEVFANFRPMEGGRLKKELFYRSASPCNDLYNRASCVNGLVEKAGIGYILDLADSAGELEDYVTELAGACAYWEGLYAAGKVLPLDMSAAYRSEPYAAAVAQAMRAVLTEEGPFLIHCTEGKDRTGFVCILLEALAGADYREIERDYLLSYENYYGLTEQNDPEGYAAVREIKLNDIVSYLVSSDEPEKAETSAFMTGAENYLLFCGMSREEIDQLKERITE